MPVANGPTSRSCGRTICTQPWSWPRIGIARWSNWQKSHPNALTPPLPILEDHRVQPPEQAPLRHAHWHCPRRCVMRPLRDPAVPRCQTTQQQQRPRATQLSPSGLRCTAPARSPTVRTQRSLPGGRYSPFLPGANSSASCLHSHYALPAERFHAKVQQHSRMSGLSDGHRFMSQCSPGR